MKPKRSMKIIARPTPADKYAAEFRDAFETVAKSRIEACADARAHDYGVLFGDIDAGMRLLRDDVHEALGQMAAHLHFMRNLQVSMATKALAGVQVETD